MPNYIHRVDDLLIFNEVVEKGGFSAAARVLNMQRSKLSRRVAELESRLGLRLLQRNTRRVSLTPVGEEVFAHAQALAREARTVFNLAASMGDTPTGVLRITAPSPLAVMILSELVARFCQAHPNVRVFLDARDQIVDLVGEGYDLAFRGQAWTATELPPNSQVIAPSPLVLVCSPALAKSAPRHPRDLAGMPLLAQGTQDGSLTWRFIGPAGEAESLDFQPRCLSSNMDVLRTMASAGLGVALVPRYLCAAQLSQGELVQILPGWVVPPGRIYAVLPTRGGESMALKRFLEYTIAELPARLA